MKYLKISLGKNPGGSLIYPVNYQEEIGNFAVDHLYYEDIGDSKLLLCIEDASFVPSMIRNAVEEINETAALVVSEDNETRVEEIKDEAKLRRLELKSRLGMPLTTEELDAVDPAKPDSIFSVSKILADRMAELKEKEVVKKEIK